MRRTEKRLAGRRLSGLMAGAALLLLAACSNEVVVRGNLPDP